MTASRRRRDGVGLRSRTRKRWARMRLPVPAEEVPPSAVDELARRLRSSVDPANVCACAESVPGTLVPAGNDDHHLFVQSCDECGAAGRLPVGLNDDHLAARLVARAVGWHVRIRFDDDSLRYWRPFVARPGDWDDRDFVCVDADEYGWAPTAEIRLSRLVPTHARIAVARLRARRRPG
jgi:hypothetical protein